MSTMKHPTAAVSGPALERQRERQRIQSILTAPEAMGREHLAQHLAFRTGVDPAAAAAILAEAPMASGESDQAAMVAELRAGMAGSSLRPEPPVTPGAGARAATVAGIRSGFRAGGL